MIDYQPIWDEVMSKFRLGLGSIHGYDHWTTVQGYGIEDRKGGRRHNERCQTIRDTPRLLPPG